MSGDVHVQFCEQRWGKFPALTYLVFVFQGKDDADKFYKVLPKRLEKYGLKLHEDKSSMIRSGSTAAKEAERKGVRLPTYKFLGFTCYWGKSREGWWRIKFKSRSDRFTSKLNGLRKYLKESLSEGTYNTLERVKKIVVGWINRKGGKHRMNWEKFGRLLKRINYPSNFKTISMFAAC